MLDQLRSLGIPTHGEEWDWKAKIGSTVVLLLGILISTQLITSLRSTIALWQKGPQKTPAIAPYAVPLAGNLYQFAFNTHGFITSLIRDFGKYVPVRIRVLNQKIYYISGAEMVQALFRGSKDLTTVPSTILVLESTFGWPRELNHIMTRDETGIFPQPRAGVPHVEPHNRFFQFTHNTVHSNLSGSSLADLAPRFMRNFEMELDALDIGHDWVEIPDFYALVRDVGFRASMNTICGPHFFRINPNFTEDFWKWDGRVMELFKSIPRWLIPDAYALRDKLNEGILAWHAHAKAHLDPGDENVLKVEWEEYYGSKLMRERALYTSKIDDMTAEAGAANDLGMLWGANANIIPMIGWEVMDTFTRPEILARCRAEISKIINPSVTTPLNVEMQKLMNIPLLQSIYSEELRLRNGVMIQRVPLVDDFQINGYKFPKGRMILASSWHEQRDRTVWNEGPVNGDFHSVEDFWADRFLVYPKDPASGPRKPGTGPKRNTQGSDASDSNNGPKFNIDSVAGSYIPYGGGAKVCPGRFYAKHEAIIGLALFIMTFDVEFAEGTELKPNMSYFPFGVVPPVGKFPARIRRRELN